MAPKLVVLAFTWTALFNVPLCCCYRSQNLKDPAPSREVCSHCSKKSKRAPSSPHSSPQQECSCSHHKLEAQVNSVDTSFLQPTGPELSDPLVWWPAASPVLAPEPHRGASRGPPPERSALPVYLLILHLTI
jgi:hypothetical protein